MVYVQRIFTKEVTIQVVSHAEKNVDDVVQCVRNFITQRFYSCDTKIIEGKMVVETDKNQAKIQIEYCKDKIKLLRREKMQTSRTTYREVIDKDIKAEQNEIHKFEKLL